MDPPEHTKQRKTVRSVSAPSNLRNIEPMIREQYSLIAKSKDPSAGGHPLGVAMPEGQLHPARRGET